MNSTKLRDLLLEQRGAKPCSIIAVTDLSKQLKGGQKNPLYGLVKQATVNGIVNFRYEKSVNNQREREHMPATFEAEPRKWGVRLKLDDGRLLPLVGSNVVKAIAPVGIITLDQARRLSPSELYMELKVQSSSGYQYFLDGREIPEDEANAQIRPRDLNGRQILDKPIIVRDYALSSITDITINGETYE